MGHRVVGRLKHDDDVYEHGESVSASDVGGQENFDALVAANSVVDDEEFKRLYPESEGEVIQPAGTPSNLAEVEGTKLQAKDQTDGNKQEPQKAAAPAPKNPADPPKVKGAGDSKAGEKDAQSNK